MAVPGADELMRDAEAQTGLKDWGWYDIRTPLEALASGVKEQGHLTERGERHFQARLGLTLRANLRMVEDRKTIPGIAKEEIRRPIVIPSLPRSGTTILSRLLGQDPANRVPLTWEIFSPSPPPRPETYATDPRIAEVQKMFDDFGYTAPEIMAMHEYGADVSEECHWICEHAAALHGLGAVFSGAGTPPTKGIDQLEVFKVHREVLQHLQYGMPAKRWILKCPPFMSRLDGYVATYPDAVFIMTHRDLGKIIPSLAKLMAGMRAMSTDDPTLCDPKMGGKGSLMAWKNSLESMMKFREKPGMEDRFLDLYYQDTLSDPIGVVEKIYERFDLPLSGSAVDRMRAWLAANPQGKYGSHSYTLADCGLTEEDIDRTYGDYMEKYKVPREKRS
jgi:hypothetical protein